MKEKIRMVTNSRGSETLADFKFEINLIFFLSWIDQCSGRCPLECEKENFLFETSLGNFPAYAYAKYLIEDERISRFLNESFDESFTVEDMSKSIAKVNIYYSDLNIEISSEMPAMTFITLVSNIGGVLGLFLGMSFLSFVEVFELGFEIFLIVYKKLTYREKVFRV